MCFNRYIWFIQMCFIPLPAEPGICHTMAARSHQQSLVPGKLLEEGKGMGRTKRCSAVHLFLATVTTCFATCFGHVAIPVRGLGFDNPRKQELSLWCSPWWEAGAGQMRWKSEWGGQVPGWLGCSRSSVCGQRASWGENEEFGMMLFTRFALKWFLYLPLLFLLADSETALADLALDVLRLVLVDHWSWMCTENIQKVFNLLFGTLVQR